MRILRRGATEAEARQRGNAATGSTLKWKAFRLTRCERWREASRRCVLYGIPMRSGSARRQTATPAQSTLTIAKPSTGNSTARSDLRVSSVLPEFFLRKPDRVVECRHEIEIGNSPDGNRHNRNPGTAAWRSGSAACQNQPYIAVDAVLSVIQAISGQTYVQAYQSRLCAVWREYAASVRMLNGTT